MTIEIVKKVSGEGLNLTNVSSTFLEMEKPTIGVGVMEESEYEDEGIVLYYRKNLLSSNLYVHDGYSTGYLLDKEVFFICDGNIREYGKEFLIVPKFVESSSIEDDLFSYHIYVMNSNGKTVQIYNPGVFTPEMLNQIKELER